MKTNVRTKIDEGVRQAIGNQPTVVVAHSLGTVVAYNVLVSRNYNRNWQVLELVTLGCPLAVSVIRDKLVPLRQPGCVGHWYNAMDSRDIVALYPLDEDHGWGIDPAIENKTDVDNPTENRHGISGYLGGPGGGETHLRGATIDTHGPAPRRGARLLFTETACPPSVGAGGWRRDNACSSPVNAR